MHRSQTFSKNTDGKFTLELVTEAFELDFMFVPELHHLLTCVGPVV